MIFPAHSRRIHDTYARMRASTRALTCVWPSARASALTCACMYAKVSVLARALGHERSPVCRVEALRALARCAAMGCPVTVACAIKHLQDNDPNVQLAAVEVLASTAPKGDKNTINALLAQLMGNVTKDPTQPGEFPVASDIGHKFSLARVPKRPGPASFCGSTGTRVAAVRALAAVCVDGDLRVAASLAHMVAEDWDKSVRNAAGNALVALGRAELASEAEALARERFEFRAVHVKRAAQLHQASPSMCQLLPLGARC